MGMMAKMRSLTPWFILTVGGIFVLFMVLSDSGVSQMLGGGERYVGSINGEEISYQQYSDVIETYRENSARQQGREIEEQEMDQIREQAWEAMVNQILLEQKIKEFGIVVTDEEIRNTVFGEDPPQYLKQNFIDSTGNFNREAYEAALMDPRNKDILLQVEEQLREQLMQKKLSDYINASLVISDSDLMRTYIEQNTKITAEYVMVSYAAVADSIVSVTDDDLREYYNKNIDEYKVDPQRKLKYVLFKRAPSKEDSASVLNNLRTIVDQMLRDTSDFKNFAQIYSEKPYSLDTLSFAKLPREIAPLISKSQEGDIIGPVLTMDGYAVYHLVGRIQGSEPFANASHIIVRSSDENDEAAKKEADDIYKVLMGGADFATVALNRSQDPGSAKNGGELGWFGKGQMVPEFEKACFEGPIGVIQKPIKTSYGYHIIKVNERTNQKFVIEQIVNSIKPSGSTLDKLFNDANDFAFLAEKYGFEKEAANAKYNVQETTPFKEDAPAISDFGTNKAARNFAFENSLNSVSEVFRVPAGYAVAMISEVIEPGVKPFDEVKDGIRPNVVREKKLAKSKEIITDISKRINGDFSKAKFYYRDALADTAKDFTIKGNVPGVGVDNAFNLYCNQAEIGKISAPFQGQRGSYMVKVLSRTPFDSTAFNLQKNSLRDRAMQQKKQNMFLQWLNKVKEESDIVDNRHLFFR